jgi:3'(2'), 5'-bisphosphate nucleotidase/myo-inositol-1(or 4)-monophosphatase
MECMETKDLIQLCDVAIEAARKAGKHISETRPTDVQRKEGGDSLASQVLTEVDGQCQEMILAVLEPTFAEFDLALLTEESPDDGSRLKKDYFWCIDPIDGTLPYIEGVPGYATSIALVSREGLPVIGVIYDPVEHTLYHAVKNGGAFRNGQPWTLSSPGTAARIFTDRSIADEPYCAEVIEALNRIFPEVELNGKGGAVMNAMWCLENAPACYFKFPKPQEGGGCFWDYAASACIYNELGGVATNLQGNRMDLNRPDSIYMNQSGVLYATDVLLAQKIMALHAQLASKS